MSTPLIKINKERKNSIIDGEDTSLSCEQQEEEWMLMMKHNEVYSNASDDPLNQESTYPTRHWTESEEKYDDYSCCLLAEEAYFQQRCTSDKTRTRKRNKTNKNNHRHGGKSTKVIHQETKIGRNRQVKRLGERNAQLEARKQNAKQRLGHRGEEEHSCICRPESTYNAISPAEKLRLEQWVQEWR